MVPYVIILVITIIYVIALGALIRELLAHPSKEERHENQSFQLICATTILYLSLIHKVIQLNACGILKLF